MNARSRREVVGRVAGFYKEGRDEVLLEEEDEVYEVERVVEMNVKHYYYRIYHYGDYR